MKKFIGGFLLFLCIMQPLTVKASTYEVTYEEAVLLMKLAQAEGGNQGMWGQWLIMSVVVNRVNSPQFPDTIREVVTQEGQFATANRLDDVEPTRESHLALARLEKGRIADEIIGFETTDNMTLDRYFDYAYTFGDHQFYILKEVD